MRDRNPELGTRNPHGPQPDVSIVVPMYNEELNVVPLHQEVSEALRGSSLTYELILVDDGSRDATFERLADVQRSDAAVHVVRLARNFGQSAAFAAGVAAARSRYIATLDGDLQNDPADIPRLVALASTHDIVCGWRRDRKDDFLTRRVPSVAANWLIGVVTGIRIHDYGCSMKVFRSEVIKPLTLRPGMHRYLPVLASQLGNRVTEVVVNHRARRFGQSKYGLSRTFRVVGDVFRMRRLMREALEPPPPSEPLYEIAEALESVQVAPGFTGSEARSAKPEARRP